MTTHDDNPSPVGRPSVRVVFDSRTGRILEAHHSQSDHRQPDHSHPDHSHPDHRQPSPAADVEHRDAITVPASDVEPGTRYRVDPATRCLVACDGDDGVGFGAGPTGSGGTTSPPSERRPA